MRGVGIIIRKDLQIIGFHILNHKRYILFELFFKSRISNGHISPYWIILRTIHEKETITTRYMSCKENSACSFICC